MSTASPNTNGRFVERAIGLVLAIVFFRSALAHLGNPYYFLSTVYAYQLTGAKLGFYIAALLPFLQITVAICLINNWWASAAYCLAIAMFLVFLIAQAFAICRGMRISCGCFGASESQDVGSLTAVTTSALTIAAAIAWRFVRPREDLGLQNPIANAPLSPADRRGFTLLELLIVVAIIALLVGLIVPAIQRTRESAHRSSCANNLRQLTIALHNYHGVHGVLPPGCSVKNGFDSFPHMSWLTRLLPSLEQGALWQQAVTAFGQQQFFQEPPHHPVLGHVVRTFLCPSDNRSQNAWDYEVFKVAFTDYMGVEGTNLRARDGTLFLDSQIRLNNVSDGTANTLALGERPPAAMHNLGWWYAGWGQEQTGSAEYILGVREIRIAQKYLHCPEGPYQFERPDGSESCDVFQYWSFHPGGAHFAFCDGSVRFLAYSADPLMPALATRGGGESVQPPD